jgi:threonine/homoserine/homoserine lactone efflux protein
MKTDLLKVSCWGMVISFLGSLPLGTLNIAATSISLQQGVRAGLFFAFGSLIVEFICVRIALHLLSRLTKSIKVFNAFKWITVLLLFTLAYYSFEAAVQLKAFGNNIFTGINIHPFFSGIILSALNPMHIPFWLGWSTILADRNILTRVAQYYPYMVGIGTGTILGFLVFIYGGHYFLQKLKNHQSTVNYTVGIILLLTAAFEIYKMLSKKVPAKTIA